MADGAYLLKLDEATSIRLRQAAQEAGLSPEDYAAGTLSSVLGAGPHITSVRDVSEATRRLADYDRTGVFVDGDEALDAFVKTVEMRAARRA
jgi:hypothetical protein